MSGFTVRTDPFLNRVHNVNSAQKNYVRPRVVHKFAEFMYKSGGVHKFVHKFLIHFDLEINP